MGYCFYTLFSRVVFMGDYEYTTMKVRKEIAGWLEEFLGVERGLLYFSECY